MKVRSASDENNGFRVPSLLYWLWVLALLFAAAGARGPLGLLAQEGSQDPEALAKEAWEAVQNYRRSGGRDGDADHPGAVYGPRLWEMTRSSALGRERSKTAEEAVHLMIHAGRFEAIDQWLNQLQGSDGLWPGLLDHLPEAGGYPEGNRIAARHLRRLKALGPDERSVHSSRLDFILARLLQTAGYGQEARQLARRLIEEHPDSEEAQTLRRNWERQGVLGAGDPIPSFQVTTVEARQLSSEAMRGKIVLIDFWSTTCGACLQDMPIIRAVHERFRESGFEVMGVAFDQNAQAVRRAAQAKKALWPQVLASQAGELPEKMGARGTPYYVLVDSRGRLASPGIGIRFLEDRVEQLLAERAR